MQSPLFTELTILLQLELNFDQLLIPRGMIIDALADTTLEFNQIVLGHRIGTN